MNLAEAKALLPEIRGVIEFASAEWLESYDTATGTSQICAMDALTGEVSPLATLSKSIPTDDRELMKKAGLYVRALLLLRDEAVREYRRVAPTPAKPKRKFTQANNCALMCSQNGAFKRWLLDCKDLQDAGDAERIKTRVRFLLNVQSLAEIDNDPRAAAAWAEMLAEFNAWKRVS